MISDKEKAKLSDEEIELMIANVKASVAMEGMEPSKETEEIGRRYLKGEITEEDALKEIYSVIQKLIQSSK